MSSGVTSHWSYCVRPFQARSDDSLLVLTTPRIGPMAVVVPTPPGRDEPAPDDRPLDGPVIVLPDRPGPIEPVPAPDEGTCCPGKAVAIPGET